MGLFIKLNQQAVDTANGLGGLMINPDPNQPYRNDQYDAFRHAYTSALVTKALKETLHNPRKSCARSLRSL
jgi:hypothetical protein